MKKTNIVFISILLIFLIGMTASFASEDADIIQDDNKEGDILSSDNDVDNNLASDLESQDKKNEIIASGEGDDYDKEVFGEIDYETAGTLNELNTALAGDNITIYILNKDYCFSSGLRNTINPHGQLTLDGQGHTIDFSNPLDEYSGGRMELVNSNGMTFKNIHFINITFRGGSINNVNFINCTFYGIDSFQTAADNWVIDNCIFKIPEGKDGNLEFGLKGSYDGRNKRVGNNNVIKNSKFINMATTITGSCGGAIIFAGRNNTVVNSTFENCIVPSTTQPEPIVGISSHPHVEVRPGGGAISFAGSDNTVDGCNFTNCWSIANGGVIYFAGGNNTVSNSIFTVDENLVDVARDHTSKAAAIYFDNLNDNSADNNIINSVFNNFENSESLIYTEESINVVNSSFNGNDVEMIFDFKNSYNNISCSTFTNNNGIILTGSGNTILNSTFINNTAFNGGALSINDGSVINSTFINNTAENDGGAIYADGTCIIDGCIFIDNSAGNQGGAIAFIATEDSHVYNSYFEDNEAGKGTAIFYGDNIGEEILENSTFVLSKVNCEVNITIDQANSQIIVGILSPDNFILGVQVENSDIANRTLKYIVDGIVYYVDEGMPVLANRNLTLEYYDGNGELVDNVTLTTNNEGFAFFDASLLFDENRPVKHLKAYHTEDEFFKYGEDEDFIEMGDFALLQYLINGLGENGVLNLSRNFTYTLGLDSIVEGVVINRNITINGNGYSIDALHKSRIFKILAGNTKIVNVTLLNSFNETVYFEGENLVINNTSFINSTTLHNIFVYGFGDVESYRGTGLIYADTSGNITISNSDFTNNIFGEYGINIKNASYVFIDNLKFNGNIIYAESYINNYPVWVGNHYEYHNVRYFSEGFNIATENTPYIILNVNASNVKISSIRSSHDVAGTFINVEANNIDMGNVSVAESNLKSAIRVNGNATIAGVDIDNITSYFKMYRKDYTLGTPESVYGNYESYSFIIYIDSNVITYEETPYGWQDTVCTFYDNAVIRDVTFKNIESDYMYLVWANTANLTMDNISVINFRNVDFDPYGNEQYMFASQTENFNFTNLLVENSVSDHVSVTYTLNSGNLTMKNMTVRDSNFISGWYALVNILEPNQPSNRTVVMDNLSFENIYSSGSNMTLEDGGWEYRLKGNNLIAIQDYGANVNISNVNADDCYIGSAISAEVNVLKVMNVSLANSLISENADLFYLRALSNMTLENILIDNMEVLETRDITYSHDYGRYMFYGDYIQRYGAGIYAVCQEGDIYLNNVSISNAESLADNLLFIGAYGNVSLEDVNVKNITSPTLMLTRVRDGELCYDTYSGVASNSINILSGEGNVEVNGMSIEGVSSGVFNPNDDVNYFINIAGENITVSDLSVNDAAIGGFIEGRTVNIGANNYLNVSNISFTNISPAVAFNYTYYDPDYAMNMYRYFQPNGNAAIFMSASIASITGVNIVNTSGGSPDGSLILDAGEMVISDVVIDNVTSVRSNFIGFKWQLDSHVPDLSKIIRYDPNEYDEYNIQIFYAIEDGEVDSSSPGITALGDIVIDNVTITNCENEAIMSEGAYLINIESSNVIISNVNIENITERRSSYEVWDEESEKINFYSQSGILNPRISISVEGPISLYNMTVEAVESSGMDSFMYIQGVDADIENISIKNSAIGSGYTTTINVWMDDELQVRNFTVDNIYGCLVNNQTEYITYYDYWQTPIFSQETYEAGCEGRFSISFVSNGNLELSDVNITNIFSGGSEGILILESPNLSADRILIENISNFEAFAESFDTYAQRYLKEYYPMQSGGGLNVNSYLGDAVVLLSNVEINNVEVLGTGIFTVNGNDITMENVSITNISQKPMLYYDYDRNYNQFISYMEYSVYELIFISNSEELSENINITRLLVDNVPCGLSSFIIGGESVFISNSTVKNMISHSEYYYYDYSSRQLELIDYSNGGSGMVIMASDVTVSDTLFENITMGSLEVDGLYFGKGLLIMPDHSVTIRNSTFIDIHSLTGNSSSNEDMTDVESMGSAIGILAPCDFTIIDSDFINCSAVYGGALYVDYPVNIINSTFKTNNATYGGAVYLSANAAGVNICNSTFISNVASINGGALYLFETYYNQGNVINISTFIANHADHDGGAFFYNNTIDKIFYDDYQFKNRTAMFSDSKLSYDPHKRTLISDSLFENNTDYELKLIVPGVEEGFNQTIIVVLPSDAEGVVFINITDENGNLVIENGEYELVNGSAQFSVGPLLTGKYNVSAYYNNYNSNYDDYHNYGYHINSTVFYAYAQFLNITANKTVFADENLTVIAQLNNQTTGTVDVRVSNGTHNLTFEGIPIVNGVAAYNVSGLYAGEYNVTVAYDNPYWEWTNTTTVTVLQRESEVNVSVKDNVYGNATKIIVEVPENQTGNVTVKINNQTFTKEITNGTVEFEIENLTAGEWQANVTFNENRVYKSNTTLFNFNVEKSNLTANAVANNVTVDQNATLNITVPDDFRGNVTVTIGGKTLYDGPADETITIEKLPAGNYTVEVSFYGDNNYNNTQINVDLHIGRVVPEINVTIADTTYPGKATASINITNSANGTVNITVDGKNFTHEIISGMVTFDLEGLSAGAKVAEVKFITADDYNGNITAFTTFTVFKANTTLIISSKGNDVIVCMPEGITGNVSIFAAGVEYSREIINGNATLKDVLSVGENSIVAIYDGNNNYTGSRNTTNIVFAKQVSFVNVSATDSVYGEISTVTVYVPQNQTGRVIITINNITYSEDIINAKAVFNISGLNAGKYIVDARYLENDEFNESANATSFNVEKADLGAEVIAENVTVAENATFIIKDFKDFKGKVNITVDGISFSGDISSLITMDKLTAGEKTAEILFYGDDNYKNASLVTNFKVTNVTDSGNSSGGNGTLNISTVNADNMTRGYNSAYDYQAAFLDKNGSALANVEVEFRVNGEAYKVKTNDDGIAQLTTSKLAVGKYDITSVNLATGEQTTASLEIVKRITENKDLTMDYLDGSVFKVKVFGDDGKIAPAGEIIDITANGVHYVAKVDKKGYASLKINLLPRTYKITAEYKGFKTTNKLVVKQTLKAVKKTTKVKKGKKFVLKAKLVWSNGKGIKGKVIKFKFKGKTYKAKTDKKGIAKVTIKKKVAKKLKKGKKYKVKVTYSVKHKFGNGYQTINDNIKIYVKVK